MTEHNRSRGFLYASLPEADDEETTDPTADVPTDGRAPAAADD